MTDNTINKGIFSQLMTNELRITDHIKYSILQKSCAAVHFILIIVFSILRIPPLAIFNVFSTAVYISLEFLLKKKKYIPMYYISFIEVCLHSYTATILTGWDSGFGLYIIAVTPVIFYMHFSLSKNSIRETFVIGVCAAAVFVTCKLFSWELNNPYPITGKTALMLYIFNSICTFAMLLFFSMLFLREIKVTHDDLEEEKEKLGKIASVDALTGLYNRRSMDGFLRNADVSGKTYSIIMCDIDDFKKVNDTYGHEAGDIVLKNISHAIVSCLRDGDYVCRWGGEEILVLTTGTSLSGAGMVAERIRHKIEETENISEDVTIKCTATIGAADSSEASSVSDIINLADERLYIGKNSGKNIVITGKNDL